MTAGPARDDWLDGLRHQHAVSTTGGSSHRVADALRIEIAQGAIPPGAQLGEEALAGGLGVSRNTVREAFRLLSQERLLVYAQNRGVFVRTLTAGDIHDIYEARRVLEVSALERAALGRLEPVRSAVEAGEAASGRSDAHGIGTADLQFHLELVGLAGSPRMSEAAALWLTEVRLAFHPVRDPLRWHRDYLVRNRAILDALTANDRALAVSLVVDYLTEAERDVVSANEAAGRS